MTNQIPQSIFDKKLEAEIKYRVEQEYEKYHNDLTTKFNGKDYWIEQITWKLADTITSLVLSDVIGEDELKKPLNGGPFTNTVDNRPIIQRNALRAQQRSIITKESK